MIEKIELSQNQQLQQIQSEGSDEHYFKLMNAIRYLKGEHSERLKIIKGDSDLDAILYCVGEEESLFIEFVNSLAMVCDMTISEYGLTVCGWHQWDSPVSKEFMWSDFSHETIRSVSSCVVNRIVRHCIERDIIRQMVSDRMATMGII